MKLSNEDLIVQYRLAYFAANGKHGPDLTYEKGFFVGTDAVGPIKWRKTVLLLAMATLWKRVAVRGGLFNWPTAIGEEHRRKMT